MSGGVDSSVAALLLMRQGYDVVGVTMRLWSLEDPNAPALNKRCCSVEDVEDARRVCQVIGAPHYFMNFEREFQSHVVDYFVREYDRGRTPHPCLACNDKIKFDFLLRRAMFLGADYVATGHYARIRRGEDGFRLLTGADGSKDQSYVLFTLRQPELERLLLPIGEYPKSEVRELAAEAGLPVANKPDSQDICFIPQGDYRKFIGERSTPRAGELVSTSGEVLGEHPGIQFFTIGQRRRLGLKGNTGAPMYVVEINSGVEPRGAGSRGRPAEAVVLGVEGQLHGRRRRPAARCPWRRRYATSRRAPPRRSSRTAIGPRYASTRLSGRSLPARRWCSTAVTRCWAVASSSWSRRALPRDSGPPRATKRQWPSLAHERRLRARGHLSRRRVGRGRTRLHSRARDRRRSSCCRPMLVTAVRPRFCDSKQLTPAQRQRALCYIESIALAVGVGHCTALEIDEMGIAPATRVAMRRALDSLPLEPSYLLLDAFPLPGVATPQLAIVRGDATCMSIAAASIVAKVARDRHMVEQDERLPGYGFARHKGYGTAEHIRNLERLGPSPIHRRTFAPLKLTLALGR